MKKQDKPSSVVLLDINKISEFVDRLAKERELSHDSSDSLNGFQLNPDFSKQYELLKELYEAENEIFKNKESKDEVILRLKRFSINSYQDFKITTNKTMIYFIVILQQYKVQRQSIPNEEFRNIMLNVQIMVKTIRNKILL